MTRPHGLSGARLDEQAVVLREKLAAYRELLTTGLTGRFTRSSFREALEDLDDRLRDAPQLATDEAFLETVEQFERRLQEKYGVGPYPRGLLSRRATAGSESTESPESPGVQGDEVSADTGRDPNKEPNMPDYANMTTAQVRKTFGRRQQQRLQAVHRRIDELAEISKLPRPSGRSVTEKPRGRS